jgi:3-phosphoshikimate 1-carboxyvinyltransferase
MKCVYSSTLDGVVAAPPSKSLTQRAMAAAFLSPEVSDIINPSRCDDARHALGLIQDMGAAVLRFGGGSGGERVRIRGVTKARPGRVQCGESGLALRMFAPILSLFPGPITLEAQGSLLHRPIDMLAGPLAALGASCETQDGVPPVTVRGPLRGGRTEVDGSTSSQFLSGLLLALPLAPRPSEILVKNLKSRSYVEMTLAILRTFGVTVERSPDLSSFYIPGCQVYRGGEFRVEGDWSAAAGLLVAGVLSGRVEVADVDLDSLQPDRAVVAVLRVAGAKVRASKGKVSAGRASLKAFDFDVGECPDLFPPLAALAAGCKGTSTIRGIERLRHKESCRDRAIQEEFTKIGVRVDIARGVARITGGPIKGGQAESHGDHRIAMALALTGLVSENGVAIAGSSCVAKSDPDFFENLTRLGGRIT